MHVMILYQAKVAVLQKLSHTIAIMILITDGKNIQFIQSISIVMI